MKLSYEDKLEIAKELRSTNSVKTIISSEYEKNLDLVICEEKTIATGECESHFYIITPKEEKSIYPLYINIHGGGFVRKHSIRDIILSSFIASKSGCKVIDIDYKVAPEHPFPTGLNECYDIIKWAFKNAEVLNIDKENIVVGGHSAGGNFTAAIALMANQSKEFKIKLQILDYAFLDADTDPADKITETDVLSVDRMRKFNLLYLENEKDKKNPLVSPILASKEMLIGLPPALIISAGRDCFRFEEERYAMMLVEAGVEVKIKRFLNSNHGFVENCQQEFEEAQSLMVDALRKTFYNA